MNFIPSEVKKYAEEDQDYKCKFCWAKTEGDDIVAQHYWVQCRDFLSDCFVMNNDMEIYSFKVSDFSDEGLLAVKFPAIKYKTIFLENLASINIIEKNNEIPESCVVLNSGNIIVLKLDKFWRKGPFTVSLYTFLVKVFSYSNKDPWNTCSEKEQLYLLSVGKNIYAALKNLNKLPIPTHKEEWKQLKPNIYDFHARTGFVALLKTAADNPITKWLKANG